MKSQLFEEDFQLYLNKLQVSYEMVRENEIIIFKTQHKLFYLVSIHHLRFKNEKSPSYFYIYEDLWFSRKEQIKSRVHSLLKLNQKIHARLCEAKVLDKKDASDFMDQNHILGYLKSTTKLGLFLNEELLAVATFSAGRKMYRLRDDERSYELIAFATKCNTTVVGGLDKLIKHFIRLKKPADIMTYVDVEQGSTEAYERLGFRLDSVSSPNTFYLNEHSLRVKVKSNENDIEFQNQGNFKLILTV
jgi:hypothetical protein